MPRAEAARHLAEQGRLEGFAAALPVDLARPGVTGLALPPEGALALMLTELAAAAGGRGLIHAARSDTRAERLARAARGFAGDVEVLVLPPWDCLPYDRASPSRAVMGRRAATLRRLAEAPGRGGRLVLTTVEALLQRLPPGEVWREAAMRLEAGQPLDLDALRCDLVRAGYIIDERVDEPGEAAIRGEVIDLFPADADEPVRLDLDEDCIGSIRRYDAASQRALAESAGLELQPASELLLDADTVRRYLQGEAMENAADAPVLTGPATSPRRIGGIEHRLPQFHPDLVTLFDYLPEAPLSLEPEVEERRAAWLEQVADAFAARQAHRAAERLAGSAAARALPPERLYLDETEWRRRVQGRAVLAFATSPDLPGLDAAAAPRFADQSDPPGALARHVAARREAGDRVVLAAPGEPERRRLAGLVGRRTGATAQPLGAWAEVAGLAPGALASLPLDLRAGFALPGLTVIAAADLGASRAARPQRRSATVLSVADLRPGDVVVHLDRGIGLLRGLEAMEEQGQAHEVLAIEYAGGAKALVPVEEIDHLWRYGAAAADVRLDRLDGAGWAERRAEVEAQLAAAATALIELARRRAAVEGPALAPPRDAHRRFAARFPFGETEDQTAAIEAVEADLARGSPPMDRLVVGDVGFGKTEVALRAAAAAALSGKQVAVVAPTTVLVRQHLQTFRRRFAGFGLRVEQLSRLAGGAEARAVKAGLADGGVHIVVGTHALAAPSVRFRDLGLLIIDEEQRFGTKHKEALRALRHGAHALTLTATPIPRTLQAALAGVLDLSVIATPPVRRHPVRTFVLPFDPVVVREALLRERNRGGQSFVVCPRIEDLAPMAERLAALLPELAIATVHGRMKADTLDAIMVEFADGEHDVLLTTNIIEAGLDIPAANTMIVWRADRFGLAQLHQLRGRVGRGRIRAAAYLLYDPATPLAPGTEQRLRTLEALEGLGAGFAISAQDLDLRGAGDLLGADQAGHVRLIGTGLYQHLLEQAIRRARGEAVGEAWSPELRLGIGLAIPADYVPEPEVRLELYGRLAAAEDEAEVAALADEIADRFGPPPPPVDHLLAHASLRQLCRVAGVARLDAGPRGIALTLREDAPGLARASALAEGDGAAWRDGRLVIARATTTAEARLQAAAEAVRRLL